MKNYAYWQTSGVGWFAEYRRRKTFLPYLNLQEALIALIVSRASPAKVLEYGSGVGRHLEYLHRIPGITVHGYDQSATMTTEMEHWAAKSFIDQHVTVGGPVKKLPFSTGAFDIVFTCEVLVHVHPQDLPFILSELVRVSRGLIFHLEPDRSVSLEPDAHGGCWAHDLVEAYAGLGYRAHAMPRFFDCQLPVVVEREGSGGTLKKVWPGDIVAERCLGLERNLRPTLDAAVADGILSVDRKLDLPTALAQGDGASRLSRKVLADAVVFLASERDRLWDRIDQLEQEADQAQRAQQSTDTTVRLLHDDHQELSKKLPPTIEPEMRSIEKILLVTPEAYFLPGGGIGTYLLHAVQAHLAAGRKVHVLTWLTSRDSMLGRTIPPSALAPLGPGDVTVLHLTDAQIRDMNPAGIWDKNISDILYPQIARIEAEFEPDIIEGTDHRFPLHTYLQQRLCGAHNSSIPVVTFNHGLLKDIYRAAALKPSEGAKREMVYEQQVVAWADYVFAPSQAALENVTELRGSARGVRLVREPYSCESWSTKKRFDGSSFVYFGRVSFAKGVDIFAGMMTAVGEAWPISELTFLGRHERMPFRRTETEGYLNGRLHPDLHSRVRYLDAMPRDEAAEVVGRHDFFANFSRSETFSYSTLEALSRGVVPLVLRRSPMAELIPPECREAGTFEEGPHRAERIAQVLSFWKENYATTVSALQAHARELTRPETYADAYNDLTRPVARKYDAAPRYSGRDVSVLMCSHNDANLAEKAIASVTAQTTKVREIIVLDDGSLDPEMCERLNRMASEKKIRLIRRRNMGLVAGRNLLVESAATDLVVFLDADDYLDPTYVEKTLRAMNTRPDELGAVLTRRKNFGLNDHECSCFLLGTPLHWVFNDFRMTALIKRKILLRLRFDPLMRNGEADDWWWWLRFAVHGHMAVQVPEALFHYRLTGDSMSLPWSEGQGALTVGRICQVVREAVAHGKLDVSKMARIAEEGLALAYERTFDYYALQSQIAARPVVELAQLSARMHPATLNSRRSRVRARLVAMLGDRNTSRLINFARRIVRSQPLAAALAQRMLMLGRLNRPISSIG